MLPADGSDPDTLLKNADIALYRAKDDGRGAYRFFEPEMDTRLQERRRLELELPPHSPTASLSCSSSPRWTWRQVG
jgi:predicted signal transduction protein with EAL and GGDEF domain